ncbi:MAG TPA: trypsin-like peptidase domain-containing protein [Thermomicrobiales bacterium]|nr:trypsin-like peptidase domain-containing protein [Thermomicrobiales bacterium]
MAQADSGAPAGALAQLSAGLADAVERAGAAVVRVEARRGHGATGIVWSREGQIVAADHTIEREDDITVGFADGRTLAAKLVARDPGTDLALLTVETADQAGEHAYTPLARASDADVRIGHLVLALGRPGADVMASLGIVSAVGGPWRTGRGGRIERYVRTDATLYTGFSGGPLVDAAGRLVAINSWTLSQGAGFAIPVGTVERVVQALTTGGVKRPYLGVGAQAVALPGGVKAQVGGQETGLILLTVEPNGPGAKSGLLIGDVLVAFNGQALRSTEDLLAQLQAAGAGQAATAKLVRGGELRDLPVTVGERA